MTRPKQPSTPALALEQADRATRWRLILGRSAELQGPDLGDLVPLDEALSALYEQPEAGARKAGLGKSNPRLVRWLGDIRRFFPEDVVEVIQRDAIERRGLTQLLFEPELLRHVTPSVELVATLLALKGAMPEATKDTARQLVRAVADEIVKRLRSAMERSVRGALDRSRHSPQPRLANLDVRRTIARNLKHWDAERQALCIDRPYFFARKHRQFEWNVIVCLDQSGSMAPSIIFGAVCASIMASLPALATNLVVFDTEVVDLSDRCHDPVDVLLGVQLGGGTDIDRAVGYCQSLITNPRKTLMLLITDLYEGGNQASLMRRLADIRATGTKVCCLLALCDDGQPDYDHAAAREVRDLDIPVFACTPNRLPDLLECALKDGDLSRFG